ncbi:hypothetical protein O6P43_030417 [Quillaja saponaria]|uniref:Uncharacterized protein n=1 Tax=Quillaja saponaria TaxID=32244 RepID=A0AAD7P7V0_QUISA|nr:hypothetical protein O6P43_030417 [Quillaja saponaria]
MRLSKLVIFIFLVFIFCFTGVYVIDQREAETNKVQVGSESSANVVSLTLSFSAGGELAAEKRVLSAKKEVVGQKRMFLSMKTTSTPTLFLR